jgi:ribonuclease BN (tRNA processing enzyme)
MTAAAGTGTIATILGSGTCVPSLERSACSVLIQSGEERLLLDAGPGTMRRLLQAGVTIFELTGIFFSHFHPDHSGELVPLLFSTKYPDGCLRKQPLHLVGGTGFFSFFKKLQAAYGEWIELAPSLLDMREVRVDGPDRFRLGTCVVQTAPTAHRPESVAYRLTDAVGKSVVYSGDTDFSEELIALARGADLLICESALPDELKVAGHLTPSEAGEMAARAGVGMLVLTHLYPECEQADLVGQCRRTFNGRVVVAKDLMRFSLG